MIYIFKIRKLQSCRVPGGSDCRQSSTSLLGGGLSAVTSELHCRQSSTSLSGGGGLTAVTSEVHCRQSSTSLFWGGGGFQCCHFRSSLQTKFNFTLVGGSNAVTTDQVQLHILGGGLTAVQNTEISVPLSHSVRSWPLVLQKNLLAKCVAFDIQGTWRLCIPFLLIGNKVACDVVSLYYYSLLATNISICRQQRLAFRIASLFHRASRLIC